MSRKQKLEVVVIGGIVLLMLMFIAIYRIASDPRPSSATQLTPEQKQLLEPVRKRLKLCEQYVRAQGINPQDFDELVEARKRIDDFIAKPAENDHYLSWADSSIRDAYTQARKPSIVAELNQQLDEASASLSRESGERGWNQARHTRSFLDAYAGSSNNGLAVVVREQITYIRALSKDPKAAPTTKLATVINKLQDAQSVGANPYPHLRWYAHTKQANRYFNAYLKSQGNVAMLLELAEAECDYVAQQVVDPNFVLTLTAESDKKENRTLRMLVYVDRLASYIEQAEKDFQGHEGILDALKKVRENFDYSVNHVVERGDFTLDGYFVRTSLHDVAREIQKIREQRGPVKFEEPLPEQFSKWLEKYRSENAQAWINGRSCEFWMVSKEHIGKHGVSTAIAGREHCYLKDEYDGRAVLAIAK